MKRLCVLILTLLSVSLFAQAPETLTGDQLAKGLVNLGNTRNLQTVFFNADHGKEISCAVIGSQIAAGSGSSSWNSNWIGIVSKAIYKKHPYINLKVNDCSMYMSDPEQGAMLLPALLKSDPLDLAFAAYSETDEYSKAACEGIIRQLLARGSAIIWILPPDREAAREQTELIKHYGIVGVDALKAVEDSIDSGLIDPETDFFNEKHQPTDLFYSYVAQIITDKLIDHSVKSGKKYVMPEPLVSDLFEYTSFVSPARTRPLSSNGFRLRTEPNTWGAYNQYRKMWVANEPGSAMTCQAEGTYIDIVIKKRATDGGFIEVSVDGGEPVMVDCSYPDGWDTWNRYNVASGLKPGLHEVTLTVSEEIPQGSTDTYVQVCGLMTGGIEK
ncbi:MAG: hypothetical protein IK083_01235 [Abditibacteriota bacterium]|nr:hypothetical protein [Abditibacteriota bacterium]